MMICSKCGGEVVWVGPFSALTHTKCKQCGAQNSQVLEGQDADCDDKPRRDCPLCGGSGHLSPMQLCICMYGLAAKSPVLLADTDCSCSEGHEQKRIVMSALFDADHLATSAEKLLGALNRKAGALERCEVADMGDMGAPARAALELEQAEAEVSEYWRAVRNAIYEYRGRAEKARSIYLPNAKG